VHANVQHHNYSTMRVTLTTLDTSKRRSRAACTRAVIARPHIMYIIRPHLPFLNAAAQVEAKIDCSAEIEALDSYELQKIKKPLRTRRNKYN
jgi:hypothetical protein